MNNKSGEKMTSCQKVFETEWFSIEAVSYGDSKEKPYYRLSCGDAVGVIAVTPDKKILLVNQFRPATGDYELAIPAGYVNDKESMEAAAKRELLEETGFVCDSFAFLGSYKANPSRINGNNHLFFGKDAKRVSANSDREEKCEVVLATKDEINKLIIEEKFSAIGAIGIYFLAQLKGFL